MQNHAVVKLGCQLSDDMSKLHRSYPQMQAFQHAVSLVNLPGPWRLQQELGAVTVNLANTRLDMCM